MKIINCASNSFNKNLVLIGDFNLGSINWDKWTTNSGPNATDSKLINCLTQNLLSQYISFPTRARSNNTPHILDLIIAYEDFISDIENCSPLGKSDHSVLHCTCNLACDEKLGKPYFKYDKGNYVGMRQFVSNRNSLDSLENVLPNLKSNVEENWIVLKDLLIDAEKLYVPKSSGDGWKLKKSWKHPITHELKSLVKRKHRLWTRLQENRGLDTQSKYKQIRNKVRKETRKINQSFQLELAKSCRENPKKFWQYINSKKKQANSIGDIEVINSSGEKEVIANDLDKSNVFANYFVKVYTIEPDDDPVLVCDVSHIIDNVTSSCFNDIKFTVTIIKDKLLKLNVNKSPGPDNIHPRLLRELIDEISGN